MQSNWRGVIVILAVLAGIFSGPLFGETLPANHVDNFTGHPRVVILSDIGNEPDDQMSLVRLLLYSNELDIEALIATTSTWQKTAVHPETMHALVARIRWCGRIFCCMPRAGPRRSILIAAFLPVRLRMAWRRRVWIRLSDGAKAIIRANDRDDRRPLWICLWGGSNTWQRR